jgi:hypothetical protein
MPFKTQIKVLFWPPMKPVVNYSKQLRRKLADGKTLDEALFELRTSGVSIFDCAASVRSINKCSLEEAKRIVESSPAWVENSDLSDAHIEGANIVRVIEEVDTHHLIFQINCPIPEGGSDFPVCTLIFSGLTRHAVESRGSGQRIIRRVEIVKVDAHNIAVRIHTDHGLREVICYAAYFRKGPFF